MPFFIPLIIGATGTGYLWYNSAKEEEKEPTFKEELLKILYPVLLLLIVLLFFRWLYQKGTN
jgi:ACR3 family arsenite efflux pump ArsB